MVFNLIGALNSAQIVQLLCISAKKVSGEDPHGPHMFRSTCDLRSQRKCRANKRPTDLVMHIPKFPLMLK